MGGVGDRGKEGGASDAISGYEPYPCPATADLLESSSFRKFQQTVNTPRAINATLRFPHFVVRHPRALLFLSGGAGVGHGEEDPVECGEEPHQEEHGDQRPEQGARRGVLEGPVEVVVLVGADQGADNEEPDPEDAEDGTERPVAPELWWSTVGTRS